MVGGVLDYTITRKDLFLEIIFKKFEIKLKIMKRGFALFEFQKEGISRITEILETSQYRNQNGSYTQGHAVLLYDEMGMGKTMQTLSAILDGKFNMKEKKALVVCPKALISVWKKEIETHFKTVKVVVFNHKTRFPELKETTIVLTSYEAISTCWDRYINDFLDSGKLSNQQLQRFIEINPGHPNRGLLKHLRHALDNYEGSILRGELLNIAGKVDFKKTHKQKSPSSHVPFSTHWTFLVMDEAQHFKNPKSKSAHSVGFLMADYRIALTGTPIMNSGNDLLSILKYGLGFFDLDWEMILNNPSGAYCQEVLDSFTFGRKKQDVAELQEILPVRRKDEEKIVLDWTNERQRVIYRQGKVQAKEMFRKLQENSSLRMNFFQLLRTLQQIALHPDLPFYYVPEEERKIPLPKEIEPSPKMLEVKRILEQYPQDKMICFCSFKEFLMQIMKPWLKTIGIKSLVFYGSSQKEQDNTLKAFHDNPKKRVLLLVKKAGSEGLNLQKAANVCVIMDPHWNKAGDEQAAQRIERIGQEKEVIVRKLFMKGSIDEALMMMQDSKERENAAWMSGRNGERKSLETQGLFLEKYDNV